MLRARFAPSPTGYLHIGGARTYIFNWLSVRKNNSTMVLRIDDTDVDRNTEASLNSIYEGLNWLNLSRDEFYRQSERLDLHRKLAYDLLEKGLAYRDFTPAAQDLEQRAHGEGPWLLNVEMRALSREESDRRAAAGEPFAIRFRVERDPVVSVLTYRDNGFLPIAYTNFLCLLGWSPKDNREQMTLDELIAAFSLEGVNHSNAVVNFSDPPSAFAVFVCIGRERMIKRLSQV